MQQLEEKSMTVNDQWKKNTSDPLGLGDLGEIEPGYDGWDQIESALKARQAKKRLWRRSGSWAAIAASVVVVVSLTLSDREPGTESVPPENRVATSAGDSASITMQDNIRALIELSQTMENQVAKLRREAGSMPAESAIYVAELEDLIAQVDNGLSQAPDSIDLWGQRVNLLLDLARLYQQQWQVEYGRIASL